MIGTYEKRRHSELPPHLQHKFSLPHNDPSIAAAAAEGARMGVEGAKLGPLSHQMIPPRKESAKQMSSGGAQVFLCILGVVLSVCVSLWTAMFSKDSLPRRISISAVAAVCSLIFALLAYAAFKKRTIKTPLDDVEISQSILREHRKSMTNSLRKSTANGDDLIGQIRRHSSVIAVDNARQHLQQQQKTANNHLLIVNAESPRTKRARASTSD
ncbi:hypothetical protein niasHS_002491 [Heterodera schachtii]|uniref:Uncharacterized protein n=1 Tax=Heterodera schachtii TaxID=97005 RepID=A0ABD2KK37_HETSC